MNPFVGLTDMTLNVDQCHSPAMAQFNKAHITMLVARIDHKHVYILYRF